MKISKNYIMLTIFCLITGFLLVTSIRSQDINSGTTEANRNRMAIELIDSLEEQSLKLETSIGLLRDDIEKIQIQQTAGEDALTDMQNLLEELKMIAGYNQVEGPGLLITLDDNTAGAELAKSKNPQNYFPEYYIIHDKNLLYLVNSLANLSEGISINNQRITATSDIRCVGTVIMVNSTRLAPPYEIRIIGNVEELEKALLESNEYLSLKLREIPIKISKENKLTLPAYSSRSSFTYTQMVKEAEEKE